MFAGLGIPGSPVGVKEGVCRDPVLWCSTMIDEYIVCYVGCSGGCDLGTRIGQTGCGFSPKQAIDNAIKVTDNFIRQRSKAASEGDSLNYLGSALSLLQMVAEQNFPLKVKE